MKLSGSKKIILLGIILLIISGIVVVALKGVKVSLVLQQHESINFFVGKEVNLEDVKIICKEVFKDKAVVVRGVDTFEDAININVESITNEEKSSLIDKMNEKYGTSFVTEEVTVNSNSNIRVRDMVKPYVKPVIISTVLVIVYMIIRFRQMNAIKMLGKIFGIIVITEAVIASLIAVCRIPLSATMINLMAVIAVVQLIVYLNKLESQKNGIADKKVKESN